jgi:ATP-dependent helicase/DNAse subunit B
MAARDEHTDEIFSQLEQAVQLDAAEFQMDIAGMISCIQSALCTPAKREGRYQETEPTVATIQQARGVVFDHVFLIGLNEGEFPRYRSQDPILLDYERDLLSAALSLGTTSVTVPHLSYRTDEEVYYFASAVHAARRHFCFSFSRSGSQGRETLPSRFLLESLSTIVSESADTKLLNEFIQSHRHSRRVSKADLPQLTNALHRREYDAAVIDDALRHGNAERLAYLQSSALFSRILNSEHAHFHRSDFTEFEGALADCMQDEDAGKWIHRTTALLSASQLESYWDCPFRWFASRVLGLDSLTEPDRLSEQDPLVRGSLIHTILEKFYRAEKLAGRIETLTTNDWQRLRDFAVNEFTEFESKQPTGLFMIWNREKSRILELLRRFFIDDISNREGFIPNRFEWKFGSSDRQVKLKIDDKHAISLRGAIDRVDLHKDGRLRILDYKSGGNRRKLTTENLLQNRALQLHLYKYAVESLLQQQVESSAYYFMREASNQKIELTEAAAAASREELTDVLRVLDSGMRGGDCWPYPEENNCKFCNVRVACGHGRFTNKWETESRQTAEYRAIRGGEA